eukprot:6213664-Pleurochrysis_carterae.AAC.3
MSGCSFSLGREMDIGAEGGMEEYGGKDDFARFCLLFASNFALVIMDHNGLLPTRMQRTLEAKTSCMHSSCTAYVHAGFSS